MVSDPQRAHWQEVLWPTEIDFPGVEGLIVPTGTVAQRPSSPPDGYFRYNSDLATFEGRIGGGWFVFSTAAPPSFLTLTDTPGSYAGTAFQALRVNGTGTALEFTPELVIAPSGALDVSGTALYETLVVSDDIIPNKKYVDDQDGLRVATAGDFMDGGANLTFSAGGEVLGLPAIPTLPGSAASKAYVDALAAGLDPKESVRTTTTDILDNAGNGVWTETGSGVGAFLTAGAAGTTTLAGILLADGNRVLVKDEDGTGTNLDATNNGIYIASSTGAGSATILTRSSDQDGSPSSEVSGGNFTFVETGSLGGSGWTVIFNGTLSVDTDSMTWSQFSDLGTTSLIADADGDTKVDVEEVADDDTVRIDTGDTPAGYGTVTDILTLASNGLAVSMGTANTAATVGAPIDLTAGTGNTTGDGGAINLTSGASGADGVGGAVNITAGTGAGDNNAGGAVLITAGASTGAGDGDGGAVDITAGLGDGSGDGGAVMITGGESGTEFETNGGAVTVLGGSGSTTSSDSDGGGNVTVQGGPGGLSGDGGGVTIAGGTSTGTGSDNAGDVTVRGGTANSTTGRAGSATLQGQNNNSGLPGNVTIRGGERTGGDGAGGTVTMDGGKGRDTGAGGEVSLAAGDAQLVTGTGAGGAISVSGGMGGGTSGDGGDASLIGGDADGSGAGGAANVTAGAGASLGGAVNLQAGASTGTDIGGAINIDAGIGGTGAGGIGGAINLTAGDAGATSGEDGGKIILLAGTEDGGGTPGFIEIQSNLQALNAAGPAIVNEIAAFNNPTLIPERGELTTGIGKSATGTLTAIGGGQRITDFLASAGTGEKYLRIQTGDDNDATAAGRVKISTQTIGGVDSAVDFEFIPLSGGSAYFRNSDGGGAGLEILNNNIFAHHSTATQATRLTMKSFAGGSTRLETTLSSAGVAGHIELFAVGGSAGNQGGDVQILAGNGVTTGGGGDLDFDAGPGGPTGDGGAVTITSGTPGATSGAGGSISLTAPAGASTGAGGSIGMTAGDGDTGDGGSITITAGESGAASGAGPNAGDVTITAGDGQSSDGGSVFINAGTDINDVGGTTGGNIELLSGRASTYGAVIVKGRTGSGGQGELRIEEQDGAGGHYFSLQSRNMVANVEVNLPIELPQATATVGPLGGQALYVRESGGEGNATFDGPALSIDTETTVDATVTTTTAVPIASGISVFYKIWAVGRQDATGDSIAVELTGGIKNVGGTTSLFGTQVKDVFDEAGSTTWDVTAIADDASDSLFVQVTGEAAHTIDWNVNVQTVEV